MAGRYLGPRCVCLKCHAEWKATFPDCQCWNRKTFLRPAFRLTDTRRQGKFKLVFSSSVMSNSLRPHRLQRARFPCPPLSPRVCSNSHPLSPWCLPTISTFVVPFFSCPQSFPASGSFPMSQFLASGSQSIGASASVLPVNIQDWFPLELTGLISLLYLSLNDIALYLEIVLVRAKVDSGKIIDLKLSAASQNKGSFCSCRICCGRPGWMETLCMCMHVCVYASVDSLNGEKPPDASCF